MPNVSTKPEIVAVLENIKARVALRSGLMASIRQFYAEHGFLEVETPVKIAAPAPEEYIEAPAAGKEFLRTSPELQMKLMLAAGYSRIYQIGPCFRQHEYGRKHREEFTMLEWYEVAANYDDLMEFTVAMMRFCAIKLYGCTQVAYQGEKIDFALPPECLTVDEACRRYAGMSAVAALEANCFDELMVDKIEPRLGRGRMTFLKDYPAARASLSKIRRNDDGQEVAERWELYLSGIEIANAYGELIDAEEQKKRFAEAAAVRTANGMNRYPLPVDFLAMLDFGMPESSGCALGVDRLAMIFSDAADIAEVKFPAS